MSRYRHCSWLFPLLLVGIVAGDLAAQGRWGGQRRRGPTLQVGQVAPDVALHPLTLTKDKKGKVVANIAAKPIKLSAFKGKAPICIFSSSYT